MYLCCFDHLCFDGALETKVLKLVKVALIFTGLEFGVAKLLQGGVTPIGSVHIIMPTITVLNYADL